MYSSTVCSTDAAVEYFVCCLEVCFVLFVLFVVYPWICLLFRGVFCFVCVVVCYVSLICLFVCLEVCFVLFVLLLLLFVVYP